MGLRPYMTQTELGKKLGLTQPRVCQLIKLGMPTDSVPRARKWKAENSSRRAPTNKVVVEKDSDSGRGAGRPKKPKPISSTGDSLKDALNNAITVADAAFERYQYAAANNLSTTGQRLSEHNKAIDVRIRVETAYRQEMERRRELIPLVEAQDMSLRGFSKLLNSLNRLPQQIAQRLGMKTPIQIADIMATEVNAIIAEARKAYEL